MPAIHFRDARHCVIEKMTGAHRGAAEDVPLDAASGRVLAEPLLADRDFPAVSRSVRDGFAVRASDTPGRLHVVGEVRAGEPAGGEVGAGRAIEIMTGAQVPRGADAVVMVEHVGREGEFLTVPEAKVGQHIDPQGCQARAGEEILSRGVRLDFTAIAMLASAGQSSVRVYKRPRVAVLATGDEIVEVNATPLPHQIRNSNAHSLAAQVRRAGGVPVILPVAADAPDALRWLLERGLGHDLLVLSGGVSAGKYDLVEQALAELGAEFYFDRVLIQPGQPVVFGRARGTFFFGLPGNPASTMVTFEVLARAALELLHGEREPALRLMPARLTEPVRHRPGLTRFLPARLSADGADVTPLRWSGSGDVPALARSNAFLVAEPERESWGAGDMIRVLIP